MPVYSRTFLSLGARDPQPRSQSMKAHLSPWRHHTVSHAAQPSPQSPLVRWREQLIYIDNTGHPANTRLALATSKFLKVLGFGLTLDMQGEANNGHYAPFNWAS